MSGFGAFSARGADAAAQLLTSDLPVLSGAFTTAFLGRSVSKDNPTPILLDRTGDMKKWDEGIAAQELS
eukprot:14343635-Ditylum_brightwellii.AAC.1